MPLRPRRPAEVLQPRQVFGPDGGHHLGILRFRHASRLHKTGDQPHVGHIQHIVRMDGPQALHRQGDHLINVIEVPVPRMPLQAGLHNLLEGLLPLAGPVDALIVVDLSGARPPPARVFLMMDKVTSGFRAMRIPRASGKGNHPITDQKILIAYV